MFISIGAACRILGGSDYGCNNGEIIHIDNLSVTYSEPSGRGGRTRRIHAVHDVDLAICNGKSLGIAGESACGKSTLGLAIMRMLGGGGKTAATAKKDTVAATVSGSITYGDDNLQILEIPDREFDSSYRWKRISMIFQGAMNSLDPVFTIREQFAEILARHQFKGDTHAVISSAIKGVSLDESVLSRYPHELSGGMKQRVVVAMALLLKPKLVIADEPTTALDVLVQAQIISLLKALKDDGTSFILVTHDLAVLSEIADVVGIMYGGQIVEFGSSHEVYNNPKHPYTQALLQSIPTLRGKEPPSYIRGSPPELFDTPGQCRFIDRCPYAMDKCKMPPPKFKTDTGYVMCWLADERG